MTENTWTDLTIVFSLSRLHIWDPKLTLEKAESQFVLLCYVRLAAIPGSRANRHTLWKETLFSAL